MENRREEIDWSCPGEVQNSIISSFIHLRSFLSWTQIGVDIGETINAGFLNKWLFSKEV